MKLLFDRSGVLSGSPRVLHFAPEQCITKVVKPLCSQYVTTDFMELGVDLKLDIENLELESALFDVVICVHVLEHVNDIKAMRELFRILSPGGVAIIAVPIAEGMDKTYEDNSIVDPKGRLFHFGQADHVRVYGRDFRDRVLATGFELDEFAVAAAESVKYSLILGDRIFLCRRPTISN